MNTRELFRFLIDQGLGWGKLAILTSFLTTNKMFFKNKFSPVKIDSSVVNRRFAYTKNTGAKNEVRLSFTLRTDIKQELKDFLELLEAATKEVKEEIEKK